ncbi:MAG: TlpA family protein disulfide reductase [Chitinophagaceae bacterium]|nr:TlpA family protein disulfide reductase [Chitinophagaceae bacterium]
MRTLIFIAVLFFVQSTLGQKNEAEPVKKIPDFSLYHLKNGTTNLLSLAKGKITFIDFWFVPCGPCFVEMNMLHELYAKYKNNPAIAFLTITFTDSSIVRPLIENRNELENDTYSYFKKMSNLDTFKLPVYFAFSKRKAESYNESRDYLNGTFNFYMYPTILIFDKNGLLIYHKTGFWKSDRKRQQLEIENLIKRKME